MCISCSSHQANEVYTNVYTKIVILSRRGALHLSEALRSGSYSTLYYIRSCVLSDGG